MGNIQQRVSEHKYEILTGTLALSWSYFAYHLRQQNQQLKSALKQFESTHILNSKTSYTPLYDEESIVKQLLKYKQNPIYRVVLTGGPCGGKSTALQKIQKHFTKKGFKVLLVPEVPTIVALGGGLSDFSKYGSTDLINFQTMIIKFKIYLETYIAKLGQMAKQPCLILCDRGIVDCAAYMPKDQYQALLDEEGWTWATLRDRRYDSVIFLNTAALGAEKFYTLANNAARHETPEEARQLDKKTLDAWIGHPHMVICPNLPGKSFDDKINKAIRAVQKTIGLESSDIIYHKFLIKLPSYPENIVLIESTIEQVYLKNFNPRYGQDKIKKRGQDNSYTYVRKYVGVYHPQDQFRQVIRVSLNSLQYVSLEREQADPNYRKVHIKRTNFTYNSYYFSVDQHDYIKGYEKTYILRFQAGSDANVQEIIPPFIEVIRDIRRQTEFELKSIAKKDY